ncbi:MAG: hypothetical protein II846_06005 [Acetobacter sp.]|nr:hypothetical protein [Acetobacter sp.]
MTEESNGVEKKINRKRQTKILVGFFVFLFFFFCFDWYMSTFFTALLETIELFFFLGFCFIISETLCAILCFLIFIFGFFDLLGHIYDFLSNSLQGNLAQRAWDESGGEWEGLARRLRR